jgi:acyl-CoA thioesterase-1
MALFNAIVVLCALAAMPAAGAAAPRIVALGDSLTAGYGLAPEESFPVRLQEALAARGVAAEVENAGVSGDTTAGGLARVEGVLKQRPDAVIVELGANDALRGLEPKESYANLDAILTQLGAKHIPVLLAGMKAPPNMGREYGTEFDAIYETLAKKHKAALYPFFLDGVASDPALNQNDGIHPNPAGVKIIVERILPYVLRLVGAPG